MSGNALIMSNAQIVGNNKSSVMAAASPINNHNNSSSSNDLRPTSVKSAALALATQTGPASISSTVRPVASNKNSKGKRRQVAHQYHDHSHDMPSTMPHITRGGVKTPFPVRLHNMLSGVEADGRTDIVSWQPHGRSFLVHKTKEFTDEIMPQYFNQGKFASFQRQLNLYGFKRLTRGPDAGSYYNELFLRGRPFLAQDIQRTKIKGNGARAASNPDAEPNFYNMPSLVGDDGVAVTGTEVQQQLQLQQRQQEQLQMQAMPQQPFALAHVSASRPNAQPVVLSSSLTQQPQPQQALISAEDPEWDTTADYLLDVLDEVLETNMDSLDYGDEDSNGCVAAKAAPQPYAAPTSLANHPGAATNMPTGGAVAAAPLAAPVPSFVTSNDDKTHAPVPLVSDDEESDAFHYYQDTLEDILSGVDLESDFELGMILERMVSE
eukprot:CAMPEP_0178503860 /NCGR_PEP_ID=MMETSP0696-20121128/18271_1 /TAXON_ID=265572 /ORGANISM="Extubocellulus spinifer, Strain CCMP396" /LENGTH=435 /DNA_ID=CAMNT_0020133029 /DNA_START=199 /DNA_END=1506 /DNA_ORIENTATION=-